MAFRLLHVLILSYLKAVAGIYKFIKRNSARFARNSVQRARVHITPPLVHILQTSYVKIL